MGEIGDTYVCPDCLWPIPVREWRNERKIHIDGREVGTVLACPRCGNDENIARVQRDLLQQMEAHRG